jgi:hypothetical protein
MASAVLAMVLVSLLVAAVQPKANGAQDSTPNSTQAQPASAEEPYAASPHPAPTSVKDLVKHKTETHRQYALHQATRANGSVLS